MKNNIPEPNVMPVDTEAWKNKIGISGFINAYYQYRDVLSCGDVSRILIVGPGQGLDTCIFKWKGYDITTFDIDNTFHPDVLGSVHDMSCFADGSFDVVIASHVLEHLAEPYLDQALKEISRVGRHALIYLPVHGRHMQLRILPGFKALDLSFVFDVFNVFKKPDGVTPAYMSGQHFWEVGLRGYRVNNLESRFKKYFHVMKSYRNKDWLMSYNFVLKSKIDQT